MTNVGSPATGITIGVIGPGDLVDQILRIGEEPDFANCALIGAPQAGEQETSERLRRIEPKIDLALFTGPLLYDIARASADLTVPATYVPTSSTSLAFGLLRALLDGNYDLARVSIDTLGPLHVGEAYAEIGVSTANVKVFEYADPQSAAEFAAFHKKLHAAHKTTLALTAVRSVAQKLTAAGVPVVRMTPSAATLRSALRAAALLGAGNKVQEAQLATIVVQVEPAGSLGYSGPSNYSQQELKLSLHQVLLTDARRMGATVTPRDENSYLIHATLGSLQQATNQFQVAPFLDRVRHELGLAVGVGIGVGRTARDAEVQAMTALQEAIAVKGTAAFFANESGDLLSLPPRPHQREVGPDDDTGSRGLTMLNRLNESLATEPGPVIVDAAQVADALDLTVRSARRVLQGLVVDGLAWPMPPARTPAAGRPRQLYRLITAKLNVASS